MATTRSKQSFSWTRCEDFIERVKVIVAEHTAGDPHGGHQNDTDPTVAEIVEAVQETGLTVSDFVELDERPGKFDSKYERNQWHRLLRVARNDPASELFEVLKSG